MRENDIDVWATPECACHDKINGCARSSQGVVDDRLRKTGRNKLRVYSKGRRVYEVQGFLLLQCGPDRSEHRVAEQLVSIRVEDGDSVVQSLLSIKVFALSERAIDLLPIRQGSKEPQAPAIFAM